MEMQPETGTMNFCPRCGVRLNPNMKFCPKCGLEVSLQSVRKEPENTGPAPEADSLFEDIPVDQVYTQDPARFEEKVAQTSGTSPFSEEHEAIRFPSSENEPSSPFSASEPEPFPFSGPEQTVTSDPFRTSPQAPASSPFAGFEEPVRTDAGAPNPFDEEPETGFSDPFSAGPDPVSADPFGMNPADGSGIREKEESDPFSRTEKSGQTESKGTPFRQFSEPVQEMSRCPHCGVPIPKNLKFCPECGRPLKKAAMVPAPAGRPVRISGDKDIARKKVQVFQSIIQEVDEEEPSPFAHDLPDWSVEPPVIPVRRRRK